MSPDFIVGVLIVVVVAVFISIFLRASIRQQSSIDRNELQQNISRQTSDLQNIFTPQLETLTTQQQGHLKELREGNEKQLEEIRKTVDEKLRDELDKRLESGFAKVQGFLSQIGEGLGEMRQMSADVGNLQKVLTNVKTKGNWGELQLEAILEDYLAPGQFEKNIVTIPKSTHRVEFAVRIPDMDDQKKTFLPIDAKFPTEAYRKLQNAREEDDKKAVENETKNLKKAIIHEAKEIRRKYVSPPHTSNIGILFLPTEGLYGEVYGIPGVEDRLRELGITLAGPITLTVILNAIQLSYRTVALEKRSGEVWDVLSATKTEFSKFGAWLDKIQAQVNTVQNSLDAGVTRTRLMNKALDAVDALPEQQAEEVFSSQVNELANEIEHEDI
jgi:DNA recombination protein RmuC